MITILKIFSLHSAYKILTIIIIAGLSYEEELIFSAYGESLINLQTYA